MGHLQTLMSIILIVYVSESVYAVCSSQASMLEDILSPANAERALRILRLAALGANKIPAGREVIEEIAVPSYPVRPNLPNTRRLPLPKALRQKVSPFTSFPKYQESYPPVVAPTVVTEAVYPSMPIPQPCAVQNPTVPEAYPVSYPTVGTPYPAAPVPLVNPFLPAASPVSALAPPTSSLLPPVNPTQVRSHFLRKIPIPPPCL